MVNTLSRPIVERYLAYEACPVCHCDYLDYSQEHEETPGQTIEIQVTCNRCGRHWHEVYKLIGIKDLEEADQPDSLEN